MKKIFLFLFFIILNISSYSEEKIAFSFFDNLFKAKEEKSPSQLELKTSESDLYASDLFLENYNEESNSLVFKYTDKETEEETEFFIPLIETKEEDYRPQDIASIETMINGVVIREKAVVILKYYNKSFKEHLERIKDDPKEIYLLGNQYFKNRQYEKARTVFSKNTDTLENLFGAAVTNRFLGNYQDAINYYGEIIYRESDLAQPYLGRGISYRNLGQYREALSDFIQYKQMSDSEEAFLALGNIYILRKEFDKANKVLNQGRNLYPNSNLMKELLKKSYKI